MKIKQLPLSRQLFKLCVAPLLRLICCPFFRPKYLRGRHFDSSLRGWGWVWRSIWQQKFLGINRHVPWPMASSNTIGTPSNLVWDLDDMNNFQTFGCYFQNYDSTITIGKGTYIAPNVGIITSNHDSQNLMLHTPGKEVVIGANSWIGMNAVILPGVVLGEKTVVGAGAVVTKSFPEGGVVLGGTPAVVIRKNQQQTAA